MDKVILLEKIVLIQGEDPKSCPEEELLPVPDDDIPDPTGNIQWRTFAEESHDPVHQVHVRMEIDPGEVRLELRKMNGEHFGEGGVVLCHPDLVHAKEGRQHGLVEDVSKHDESIRFVKIEYEDGSNERHALNITNIRSVADIGAQHIVEQLIVGTTLLENTQLGKCSAHI